MKLNWDVATNVSYHKMGIGIIVRNNMGEVLACLSSSRCSYSLLAVAECRVLLRAFEFCQEMGFTHVEFEGDDQTIVQAIKKEEECCILYGTLVEEAKQVLKANG